MIIRNLSVIRPGKTIMILRETKVIYIFALVEAQSEFDYWVVRKVVTLAL